MSDVFVLVHSPIVGPLTWAPVAAELPRRGLEVLVPAVRDRADSPHPCWRQEADSVAAALAELPGDRRLILAGHSGAGQLLPAIWAAAGRPSAVLVFVDAGIPADSETRLDEMRRADPAFAARFRAQLAAGGHYPEWTDDDLRPLIPDDDLRRGVLAELHPRGLAFFTEPIPGVPGWRRLPCGYLGFSESYAVHVTEARRSGWACREVEAGHFHLLVDPVTVASVMLEVVAEAGDGASGRPA